MSAYFPLNQAPRCTCEAITSVIVSGDQESVFCGRCEGLIGSFNDVELQRLDNGVGVVLEPSAWPTRDVIEVADDWLIKGKYND